MKDLMTSILTMLVLTFAVGLIYPLAVTGIAQIVFPRQANGSLIVRDGIVVGSELIGQRFSSERYFHSRPSAAGSGYDAAASGGSNLGPTSKKLIDRVTADVQAISVHGPGSLIPADLLTTSASGLDPHISPAAAEFQISRVAKARNISEKEIGKLVERSTQRRTLGLLGEPRVNVVMLNLELDKIPQ